MDLLIHQDVEGTTSLRLEDKTAQEGFDILVHVNALSVEHVNGVLFVQSAAAVRKRAAERGFLPSKFMFDAYRAQGLSR